MIGGPRLENRGVGPVLGKISELFATSRAFENDRGCDRGVRIGFDRNDGAGLGFSVSHRYVDDLTWVKRTFSRLLDLPPLAAGPPRKSHPVSQRHTRCLP